jgi:hypothetical protein
LAVGAFGPGNTVPYSLVLDGGTWREVPVPWPYKSTFNTKFADGGELFSVSCQPGLSCVAVGMETLGLGVVSGNTSSAQTIAYRFERGRWAPLILPPSFALMIFNHVLCDGGARLDCIVTGLAYSPVVAPGGPTSAAMVRYEGGLWAPVAVPLHGDTQLGDVWCGKGNCIAVGAVNYDIIGANRPLVLTGTGSTWAEGSVPAAARHLNMETVSCVSTTSTCAAVGKDAYGGNGHVFDWLGSWRPQPASFPPSADDVGDISCAPVGNGPPECTVVGGQGPPAGLQHPFVLSGAIGP